MPADIWVDFNELRGDELVTLQRFARPGADLTPGTQLRAGDDDGLECDAVVVAVEPGGVVRLRVVPGSLRLA